MAGGVRHLGPGGKLDQRGAALVVAVEPDTAPPAIQVDDAGAVPRSRALEDPEQPGQPVRPLLLGETDHRKPGVEANGRRATVHVIRQLLEPHEGRTPPTVPVRKWSESGRSGWRT
jgi:hypothetical protein